MNQNPADDPNEAQSEAHEAWSLRLAARLDGELDAAQQAELDLHLRDCARCRGELKAQRAVRERLAREPRLQASRRLRALVQTLAAAPATERAPDFGRGRRSPSRWSAPTLALVAGSGWLVAGLLALVLAWPTLRPPAAEAVPMLADALADYRRHRDRVLPGPADPPEALIRQVLGRPAAPLALREATLVSSWVTEIGGEPAVALAYRSGRAVIVQYLVSDQVFFRQPQVREAVARDGRYQAHAGREQLVAEAGDGAGHLLVGSAGTLDQALPPTL